MADNKDKLKKFCDEIIRNLETVFINIIKSSGSVVNRDKLWRNFFVALVNKLPKEMGGFSAAYFVRKVLQCNVLPASHRCTVQIADKITLRNEIADNSKPTASLYDQEGNALRYTADSLCRHLRKKIERSKHSLKEELILCLMTLVKGMHYPENTGTNEEWIDSVDQEGLWHV